MRSSSDDERMLHCNNQSQPCELHTRDGNSTTWPWMSAVEVADAYSDPRVNAHTVRAEYKSEDRASIL